MDTQQGEFTAGEGDVSSSRRIGQSDLHAFPLALGTAVFGWTLPSGRSRDVLDRFTERGGELIDTADSYSSGLAEQIIGSWMRERGNRDQVLIATKVGRHPEFSGLSRANIVAAVDASLERLQTDHIDLLYFHAEDDDVSLEESLAAAETLISSGKVRVLGASNFGVDKLLEARIASGTGLPRFEAVALEYSLMRRDIVDGNVAMMAQAQSMSIMPYFILANGFLGRHRSIKSFNPSDIRARRAAQHGGRQGTAVLRELEDIAMSHGADVSTIAAAWVLARPGVGIPAIGVESLEELDALMNVPFVELTRHEIALLDKVSAEHTRQWIPGRKQS